MESDGTPISRRVGGSHDLTQRRGLQRWPRRLLPGRELAIRWETGPDNRP